MIALAYFFDASGLVLALIPAVLVHEIGHVIVLIIFGADIHGLDVGMVGLRLNYGGQLGRKGRVAAIAAGPIAGGMLALALMNHAVYMLRICGSISAALSLFNMLPALPLDGGRLLQELEGDAVARRCSAVVAWGVILLGIFLLIRFGVFSLLVMGVWLVLHQGLVR